MSVWPIILCGWLGMGIVSLVIPTVLRGKLLARLLQRTEDFHHTHQTPIPRLGGLALVAALLGVELLIGWRYPQFKAPTPAHWGFLLSSLLIFALGFWDDIRPLGAKRKLVGQVLVAGVACAFGISIQSFKLPFSGQIISLHGWGALVTVLWLVGMTNLINLIDGVDGLAGGICAIIMALLCYVGHQGGGFALETAGMLGALLGFLWFNFPPARIYLGDGGAYLLGFQIGLFSISSSHKGTVAAALVAPLFVLALPILDTLLALLRRGLRGLPVFRPDRKHIHHRLLDLGLSRRKVVLLLYAITLLFLAMGLVAYWSEGKMIPILLGLSALMLLVFAGKFSFSREWFAVGRVVGHSLRMRQEVRYALSVTRCLTLEGSRRTALEDLWKDLVVAAQKLGFAGVRLNLADGSRSWEPLVKGEARILARQQYLGAGFGTLDLQAKADEAGGSTISDPKMFELLSELLAEGWVKAARAFQKLNPACMTFAPDQAEGGRQSVSVLPLKAKSLKS